jgi:hypothetical protein
MSMVVTIPMSATVRPALVQFVPIEAMDSAPVVVIAPAPTSIEVKPDVIEPAFSAPTVVSEEVTTLDASVVPLMLAAALTVSVASGKVIVRSAEGLVIANDVSIVASSPTLKDKRCCPLNRSRDCQRIKGSVT